MTVYCLLSCLFDVCVCVYRIMRVCLGALVIVCTVPTTMGVPRLTNVYLQIYMFLAPVYRCVTPVSPQVVDFTVF